jgi:hypothetical protein
MTPEDRVVCLCTRQKFDSAHRQELVDLCRHHRIAWDTVFATAKTHKVAPLNYVNLIRDHDGDLGIPQKVSHAFKKSYIDNILVKQGVAKALDRALELCAGYGIDVMLIKGEALNRLVYDQAWYTVSYDVDLVFRSRKEEMDSSVHRDIFETLEAMNRQKDRFKEHLEFDYYAHHDMTMNNVLTVDPAQIWRESRQIRVGNHDVFVMTEEDMLLAAAINGCRKRFFRLKSLCDIATILEECTDLDWESLVSKANSYGCSSILYAALIVTQQTVSCRLPEGFLDALGVNPIRASVINQLVNRLCQRYSLLDLHSRTDSTLFGRGFSWTLVLTYSTYHIDHVGPKVMEIYRGRRNVIPWVS